MHAACRTLNMPVLIVDGALDLRPRRAVDTLGATLPQARRVTIPDAGHMPWAEKPHLFVQTIADFLARPTG